MSLHFTKMHGCGNDFIFIDCLKSDIADLGAIAGKLCDRRFGIGADQLLTVHPSDKADFKMEIYNADGSQVEMCGNGIRCFAKYVYEHGLTQKKELEVETLAGIKVPERAQVIRVLLCESCGAPLEAPVGGGPLTCTYCRAQNVIATYPIAPLVEAPLQLVGAEKVLRRAVSLPSTSARYRACSRRPAHRGSISSNDTESHDGTASNVSIRSRAASWSPTVA